MQTSLLIYLLGVGLAGGIVVHFARQHQVFVAYVWYQQIEVIRRRIARERRKQQRREQAKKAQEEFLQRRNQYAEAAQAVAQTAPAPAE